MVQIVAALQSILSTLHGLEKAAFLAKILRENVLDQFVGIAAFLGGGVR
jgi:hypothetical protein